jgi:hypothetical protein
MIPPELAARVLATAPPFVVRTVLAQAAGGRAVVIRSARPDAAEWSQPDTLPGAPDVRRAPIVVQVVEDDPLPGQGIAMGPQQAARLVREAIGGAPALVINGCSEAFNPPALVLAIAGARIHGRAVVVQCAARDFGAWHRACAAWAPAAEVMVLAPTDGQAGRA